MDKLIFRRQFLLSSTPTKALKDWQFIAVGDRFLYVHPDCEVTSFDNENQQLVLIGYFLDPHNKEKSNLEILKDFAYCTTVDTISERLFSLVGRFVLIIQSQKHSYIFNDACGLKTVYYTREDNDFFAASQPLLLKLVLNIQEGVAYKEYLNSNYVKWKREHWLPCGVSLFKNVEQLVPNHYLDLTTYKEIRYWPNKKVKFLKPEEGIEAMSSLLKNTMLAANLRFDLAMAMTAGLDSRIVLSGSKAIADDLFFYTLKYRNLSEQSADIKVPKTLLRSLGYKHHVLDCKGAADEAFLKIYEGNTHVPHSNDWGTIAYGIHKNYPQSKMAIRGNCVEIGCYAYLPNKQIRQSISVNKILEVQEGWKEFDFAVDCLDNWFEEVKYVTTLDYDIMDIFFWEHRIGSWQAQSQLEWDLVQEMFVPFNNREILTMMLGVDERIRVKKGNYSFLIDLIKSLWPEMLQAAINPKSNKQKIKSLLKSTFTTLGVVNVLKKIHR